MTRKVILRQCHYLVVSRLLKAQGGGILFPGRMSGRSRGRRMSARECLVGGEAGELAQYLLFCPQNWFFTKLVLDSASPVDVS